MLPSFCRSPMTNPNVDCGAAASLTETPRMTHSLTLDASNPVEITEPR